jgi:mevalonate kinase
MQFEEQQRTLVRKRRTLTSFLAWSLNDDDFVTNYAIVNELNRLGEQIKLQHLARMKVLILSASNLILFSHLATLAHMRIVRHNLLKKCDVIRLPKLSASTAVLWSDVVIKHVRHGKKMSGAGAGGTRVCLRLARRGHTTLRCCELSISRIATHMECG